jgi:hypothetical protein
MRPRLGDRRLSKIQSPSRCWLSPLGRGMAPMSTSQRPTGRQPAASKIARGGPFYMGLAPMRNMPTRIGSGQLMTCGKTSTIASRRRPANAISTRKPLVNDRRPPVVNGFLTRRLLVALWPNALLLHDRWRQPKLSSCGFTAAASTSGRPPDFAATATRGCSCTFAIRAGLLLARGARRGAALTGSCSVSEGFGRRG